MAARLTARAAIECLVVMAGMCACGLPSQGHAASPSPAIETVTINGSNRLARETVASYVTLHRGDAYDAARADDIVKALYATGQFTNVEIAYRERERTLAVHVVEAPLVAKLSFDGNSALARETLLAAIKLRSGEPVTTARAHQDALALRALYRSQGRLASTVEPRIDLNANGTADVVFVITEAAIAKVSAIRFEGNTAFTAGELEGVIRTTRSSWLDILKSDAFYDPDRLAVDRDLLLAHYRKHGYRDAKIVAATGTPDTVADTYIVSFTIDEGPEFKVSAATIEGTLDAGSTSALAASIETRAGDVYDPEKAEKTARSLTRSLVKAGNAFATVHIREERDEASHTVKLTYVAGELPRAYVARIDIRGNTRTHDSVIRRELRLAEGDAIHPLEIDAARARLQRLGLFTHVDITQEKTTEKDRVSLIVAVEENKTLDAGFGVGYSQTAGVIGDISLEERNLMGSGHRARLKLAAGTKRQEAELGYTVPHAFGTDLEAGGSLVYKDQDRRTESSYQSRKIGAELSLTHRRDDNWTLTTKYGISRSDLYDIGDNASDAIKEAAAHASEGRYVTSTLGYTATYDDRDRPTIPTSGTLISLGQDFAGVGGDVRYIRSAADLRTYYSPSEHVTLGARVQAGTIAGWGGDDVRLLDMYYRGGDLVRGFRASGLGPRDMLSANQDALGGTTYVGATLAASFDLPMVPKDVGLRGEVFADAGSLFGLGKAAAGRGGIAGGKPQLRASVGAGLVWDSPIGPLRADYAVPVVSQSFDKTQPLSFGFGQF